MSGNVADSKCRPLKKFADLNIAPLIAIPGFRALFMHMQDSSDAWNEIFCFPIL